MIRVAKPKKQKAQAGPVNAGRLKSFVERVEKLEEERKAIGDDVRDVYAEAHGIGYDKKTIRWMVRERKVDSADRDERDSLRITYAHALGMAVDAVSNGEVSLRQAEGKFGVSKSSIHRALAVPEVSQVEMTDGDLWVDGVIIEDAAPQTLGDASAPVAEPVHSSACPPQPLSEGGDGIGHQYFDVVPPNIAAAVVRGDAGWAEGISLKRTPACNDPRPATWQGITLSRDAFEAEREAAREAERVRRRAEHAKAAARNAEIDADPLTIPAFLRKQVAASVT